MDQLLKSFGIEWTILIWQIINFGIVFLVLSKLLYKPLKRVMEERENKVAESLKKADDLDKKSDQFEKELEDKMSKQRKEIEDMHAKALANQENLRKKMKQDAEEEAQKIIKEAKEIAAAEKDQILTSLEDEIKALAVSIASKVLEKEIDEKKQREFLQEALKSLK